MLGEGCLGAECYIAGLTLDDVCCPVLVVLLNVLHHVWPGGEVLLAEGPIFLLPNTAETGRMYVIMGRLRITLGRMCRKPGRMLIPKVRFPLVKSLVMKLHSLAVIEGLLTQWAFILIISNLKLIQLLLPLLLLPLPSHLSLQLK